MRSQAARERTLQIVAAIRLEDSAFRTLRHDYSTGHNAADKPNQLEDLDGSRTCPYKCGLFLVDTDF